MARCSARSTPSRASRRPEKKKTGTSAAQLEDRHRPISVPDAPVGGAQRKAGWQGGGQAAGRGGVLAASRLPGKPARQAPPGFSTGTGTCAGGLPSPPTQLIQVEEEVADDAVADAHEEGLAGRGGTAAGGQV